MINSVKQGRNMREMLALLEYRVWRVTLLSIQGRALRILPKGVMKRMKEIRSQTTPVYGIREVEYSFSEVKSFREYFLSFRCTNKIKKDKQL